MKVLKRKQTNSGSSVRIPPSHLSIQPISFEPLGEKFPHGMTVQQIVDALALRGEKMTEATFRKYVQIGLLPRSVRVGRKGKHRGSQGLYPSTTVDQVVHIRRLMARGFTIPEIQKEFLFVRGEVEALRSQLDRIFSVLKKSIDDQSDSLSSMEDQEMKFELEEVKKISKQLQDKLLHIEQRLTHKAKMERATI